MKSTLQDVPVSSLVLDPENPRLYHLSIVQNRSGLSEAELEEEISEQSGFMALYKSVMKRGIEDPLWVKKSNGKFIVHEGNRRTCVLRRLIADGKAPPPGIRYDIVRAHVAAEDTTDLEIKIMKVSLQTGKKDWSPVGVAAAVHELHYDFAMAEEDIATDMQISVTKVKSHLKNYRMYTAYVKETSDTNEKRFTYFADAPKKVMNWVGEGGTNKSDYYKWINPMSGQAKIRSAAAGRGSLREFAKCLEDPEAIQLLRDDVLATVEDAYEVVKSNDILKDMTFLNRVLPMAKNMRELDEIQLTKIAADPRLLVHIRSLESACKFILRDIADMDNSISD